jgi:hypothetical protein
MRSLLGRNFPQCENDSESRSAMGQERRIGAARNISALPPRADVGVDIVTCPRSANSVIDAVQQTVFTAFHPDEILVLVRAFYRGL